MSDPLYIMQREIKAEEEEKRKGVKEERKGTKEERKEEKKEVIPEPLGYFSKVEGEEDSSSEEGEVPLTYY